METDKVIKKFKTNAQGMANAWYALHVLNIDELSLLKPFLRTRFGIDRQLCYNLICIICRGLNNIDVSDEIKEWINSAVVVRQSEIYSIDLINQRINFLKEVIQNELYSLKESGQISETVLYKSQVKITKMLDTVIKEYKEYIEVLSNAVSTDSQKKHTNSC
ncbi:hypothetical protein [Phosphitispora sp. TUW77]|uniref:hypothetical protein n=1 Tax=Phosphitispora sp. TUW77 TaxID=3152361 RepID=UPI003AB138E6